MYDSDFLKGESLNFRANVETEEGKHFYFTYTVFENYPEI